MRFFLLPFICAVYVQPTGEHIRLEQLPHIWETAMAGAPEAEAGTEVAMDVHMSLTTPVFSFSFSVKIADKLLAAGAIVGGVTLAVLVSQQPERVADAVRSVLQAPGLAVQSIMPGSILVTLECNKVKSFLLFIERFETGIVKQQLEEQFKKLGLKREIEVTLVNSREWYQEIDQIRLCVGVDVGETNTDAVILLNKEILCSTKVLTTWEVTAGIVKAISSATKQLPRALQKNPSKYIARVNIGTTHFVNAIVQRKNLAKVAVLRLCAQATTAIPPLCDFPDDLKNVIGGMHFFLSGGYQYNGTCIADVDEEEVKTTIQEVKKAGIKNVVIVGVFSPVSGKQEDQVGAIIKSVCPDMSITLSHEVGLIGLLERENAAVLNESLKPLCNRTVKAFCGALNKLGLKCPLYLTQNDGTIISAERIRHLPVYTFASGPTNSIRGAAFLSGTKDAIVIDIGGTTTDVGLIKGGFPKQASTRVKIGGVSTNFRMPDVLSIQLGGGSVVQKNGEITVGPRSVGYKLTSEALVFEGGKTMTSTDIAVASGFCDDIGDKERVKHIPEEVRTGSLKFIKKKIEAAIDRVKISKDDQLVILVGGGSILANPEKSQTLKGASKVVCPEYYQVANAVGAALSEVSGTFDQVISMDNTTREDARTYAEKEAKRKAVEAGADEKTLEVIDVVEVPLAYLPGNAVRYYLKVIGDLKEIDNSNSQEAFSGGELSKVELTDEPSSFEQAPVSSDRFCDQGDTIVFKEPFIDPATGDWILNKFDIECISIGAGILGCGGGGSPYLGRLRTLELLKAGKEIRIIHPNKLGSSPSLTGPVGLTALMGAPMIDLEKLFSGRESNSALEAIQTILFNGDNVKEKTVTDGIRITEDVQLLEKAQRSQPHKKIVAIVCGDVGGINSMEPLAIGAERGLPIVDADGVGRAFPELQMLLPFVYGSPPYPAAIGDEKGNVVAVTFANSPKSLEDFFREKTIEMGCASGFAVVLDWKDVKEKCVPYSLSRVWRLGNSVLRAKHKKVSPVSSILQYENGKVLIVGKIADIHRVTEGGFNKGSLIIEGSATFSGIKFNIEFQNENYVAFILRSDGSKDVLATVPDLISLVDEDTGQPIITEEVRYGLRVAAIASPCFPQWATPQGLATVGPAVFGYQDVVYNPVNVYKKHPPIPAARN